MCNSLPFPPYAWGAVVAKDKYKTKAQLIEELEELRRTLARLKAAQPPPRVADKGTPNDEQTLRRSEAMLRAMFDGITVNLAFVNQELEIQWANEAAATSVGKRPEDMVGQKCHTLWADPNQPCENCPTVRAFQTHRTESTIIRTPDGRVWDEKGEPVFDEQGELLGVLEIAHDITDMTRAEQELLLAKFSLDSASASIFWIDPKGRFTYVNDTACQKLGYTRDELVDMSVDEVDPDFPASARAEYWKKFKKSKVLAFETRHRTKAGVVIPVEVTSNFLEFQGREYEFAFVTDISQRKQAEQERAQSEERFSKVFKYAPLWVTLSTLEEGTYLDVNDAYSEITGYSRREVIGKTSNEVGIWPDPAQRTAAVAQIKRQGTLRDFHIDYRTKSGEVRHALWSAEFLEWDGQTCLISVLRDITDRIKAQEALRKSEEKFSKVFKSSPNMVTIATLDEGRFLEVNDAFSDITGYSRRETLGRASRELGLWVDIEQRQRAMEVIDRDGSLNNFPVDLRHKSGRVIHALWSSELLDIEGETCLVSVLNDVSERVRAQKELAESEARFRAQYMDFPTPCYIWEHDGRDLVMVDANPAAHKYTGGAVEGIFGTTAQEHWQDDPEMLAGIQRCYNEQKAFTAERPAYTFRSTGEIRHVLLTFTYAPPRYVFEYTDDITDRKRAEAALKKSEATLRSVIKAAPIGLGLTVDRVISWANDQVSEISGYSPQELEGQSARMIYGDDAEFDRVGRLKYPAVERGEIGTVETRWRRKDGQMVDVLLSSMAVDPDDLSAGVVFSAIDITERKATEFTLRARARQQAAVAQLGQLALTEPDLTRLMDQAVELLQTALEVDLCKVLQLNPTGDSLLLKAGRGWRQGLAGRAEVGAGQDSQAGYTLLSSQPVIVEDMRAENRFSGPKLLLDHGVVSGLSVVIGERNNPYGVLGVHTRQARSFSEQDVNVVQSVANILAAAIERQRTGEALKTSEQRFRDLAQLLPEIIFETDPFGKLVFVNQAAFDQMGFNRRDFEAGIDVLDMIAPEDQERAAENIVKSLKGQSTGLQEYRAARKDGSIFPCLVSSTVIIQDGQPIGLRGFAIDISQRKQAEQALAQSEARYRELFNNMSSGVAVYEAVEQGRDFVFKEINQAGERITQTPRRQLLGKKVSQAFPGVKDLGLFQAFQRVCQSGQPEHHPTVLYQDQRLSLWVENYVCKLPSGEIVAIFDDITQRKRAEDSLQWELFINTALATMSHAMISNQADVESVADLVLHYARQITGSEHGYISTVDHQSGDNVGHTMTQMMGEPCQVGPEDSRIAFPANPDGTYPGLWGYSLVTLESFFSNDPAHHPSAQGLPEGHIPLDNFLSVPVTFAGKLVGQVALANALRDYTERDLRAVEQLAELFALSVHRKQAEEEHEKLQAQLRQTQKMEAIGTLAGGIAHDFNNVLAAIMGYTELTLGDLPAQSEAHGNLEQVLKAAQRAKDLVSQILSFSRRTEQEKKPVEIGLIIKEVLKLLRASLPAFIEIQTSLKAEKDKVLANPVQIHQLIMNLCTNAAQAMPDGGLLLVEMSAVDMSRPEAAQYDGLQPGRHLRLKVSDTGEGMVPEVMERIFEPFFTTKPQGEGTGMGLSVVHGLVKNHGGAISVYSEPGQGSSFNILLPTIEVEGDGEALQPGAPLPGGQERVLLIDDEPALADIGRHALERLGYRVQALTSGQEALELFAQNPHDFDLVITDYTMPQITGVDLAGEIHQIRPEIPVIMCTGFSGQLTAARAREMGLSQLLVKPLVSREMALVVRQVLDDAAGDAD